MWPLWRFLRLNFNWLYAAIWIPLFWPIHQELHSSKHYTKRKFKWMWKSCCVRLTLILNHIIEIFVVLFYLLHFVWFCSVRWPELLCWIFLGLFNCVYAAEHYNSYCIHIHNHAICDTQLTSSWIHFRIHVQIPENVLLSYRICNHFTMNSYTSQ